MTIDDDTSVTTAVTIPALTADTELTFTLTVTGRGAGGGIAPGTDTATVTVTASADATLESLTVNDGRATCPLPPPSRRARTSIRRRWAKRSRWSR